VSVDKEINFNVPPSDAPNLPVGTTVNFVYLGHPWPVKVSQSPSAPINGVVPMVAAVPRSFPLPYGAVGTVSYSLTLAHGAIIPIGALQTNEDKEYVFAIQNGKAVIRNVTILGQSESSAAVSGVDDGMQVIMNPPPGLLEGVAVKIVSNSQTANEQSASPASGSGATVSQGPRSGAAAADPAPSGMKSSASLPSAKP